MNNSRGDVLALAGRVLLAVIFIQGGYGKLMAKDGSIAYIASTGLPMPPVAYWVSVVAEFLKGIAILFGFQSFLTALALALFCLATAFAVHLHAGNIGQMINF